MAKIVNDTILGIITLKPHIVSIINTIEFQRLRWIQQMGFVPFVYPTGNHTRFEHSIGTYWLASNLITKIQKELQRHNDLQITDKEVKCVEIAAVCHDIGHGPFSHFWERSLLTELFGKDIKSHEKRFKSIWELMKSKNAILRETLHNEQLTTDDEDLIDRLISGTPRDGDKKILFSVVSNKESDMDVDKLDYVARDSIRLGHITTNFTNEVARIIHFAKVIKGTDGQWTIAFKDTESLNIMQIFQMRHYIHQRAAKHSKVVGIDKLVSDGFFRCLERKWLNKEDLGKSEWIAQHNDCLLWELYREHKVEEFRRLFERDLYHIVMEAVKYEISDDPTETIEKYLATQNVDAGCIRFSFSKFTLGNGTVNPITKIPFYTKFEPDKVFYFSEDTLPANLNLRFHESRLLVFRTTKSQNCDHQHSCLDDWLRENGWNKKRL